jgi:hypothetical protein
LQTSSPWNIIQVILPLNLMMVLEESRLGVAQRSLTFHFHHPLPFYTSLPSPVFALSPLLCTHFSLLSSVEPLAPDMVLSSSGPPGLKRPKSSSSLLPPAPSSSAHIFSPAPSKPSTGWFNLLASPVLPLTPQLPPPAVAAVTTSPAPYHTAVAAQPVVLLQSSLVDNHLLLTNISSDDSNLVRTDSIKDPWARAHIRVCVHAKDECAACSISLICCSCCALRYTPGPPPSSPAPTPGSPAVIAHRSRSASPALFRDLGNPPSPPFMDWNDTPDDDAYAHALAECDTCDNSSCPRGVDAPASWSITVEQFDLPSMAISRFFLHPFPRLVISRTILH